jgi:sulfate transport system substrate-binding protein
MKRRLLTTFALALAAVAGGCQSQGSFQSDTLKLGAYSVVREVFHDGLIPAFAARWKSKTGRDVQFE